jgi:pimeloyl-ACP methyl ester carboxylesterase
VYRSEALETRKPYYVYEAPGVREEPRVPLIVLLRGHEREWVNVKEDDTRRCTAIEDVDRLVQLGFLPPVRAVMPGLNSIDNHVPSLGIDMEGTWANYERSLGTGRFWTYLTEELLPDAADRYAAPESPRLVMSFSLGGFTASLLAARTPDGVDHVAIYDGLFPWPCHSDPREEGEAFSDPVWTDAGLFGPALGDPPKRGALRRWNPIDRLKTANQCTRRQLQNTTFWVACAAGDGDRGNRDRARFVVRLLRERDVPLGLDRVIFHGDARHTWHWADLFLLRVLLGALPRASAVEKVQALNDR